MQVLSQEPVPLRQLNAGVPRDLETIAPEVSGKEPLPPLRHGPRPCRRTGPLPCRRANPCPAGQPSRAPLAVWCKRNPVVAALTTAVVVLSVAGAAISTYFAVVAGACAEEASAGPQSEPTAKLRRLRRRGTARSHNDWRLNGTRGSPMQSGLPYRRERLWIVIHSAVCCWR